MSYTGNPAADAERNQRDEEAAAEANELHAFAYYELGLKPNLPEFMEPFMKFMEEERNNPEFAEEFASYYDRVGICVMSDNLTAEQKKEMQESNIKQDEIDLMYYEMAVGVRVCTKGERVNGQIYIPLRDAKMIREFLDSHGKVTGAIIPK